MDESIQSSAAFSLLGYIPKKLRAVAVSFSEESGLLNWNSYFYEPLSEEELEEHKIVTTDFLAGLDMERIGRFEESFQVIPYPERVHVDNQFLIYHSAEPGYLPSAMQELPMTYGNIQLSGIRSLNGYVEPHLVQVFIELDELQATLKWIALFDVKPDQRDFQIQSVAASRFISVFKKNIAVEISLYKSESSTKSDMRLIFLRK